MADSNSQPQVINVNDDDEDVIDQEQLDEYQEMIDQLGSFPDKIAINSLSMVAEDHLDSMASARAIYNVIRTRLLNTHRDNMLPLVYVLDSILKNVKGKYIDVVEEDAKNWMHIVYRSLLDAQRTKLEKVWKTWEEYQLFAPENWRAMGRCFDVRTSGKVIGSYISKVAGISRTNDGKLILPAALQREMQSILDEMQEGVENELEKVSLEKLADLNPELLATIKQTAEESMRSDTSPSAKESSAHALPSFLVETRSQAVIERSKAWNDFKWNHDETKDIIVKLENHVHEVSSSDALYTQHDALAMMQYLAAASATATVLRITLQRMNAQETTKPASQSLVSSQSTFSKATSGFTIDMSLFTNDGIKTKNETVIGLLYEIGLPFVSSTDGRRFASQLELSNHLDTLFKRNQLEKSIARTEERGWYIADVVWTGETKEEDLKAAAEQQAEPAVDANDDGFDPETSTVPADESRDRCVICGINFKMFFDNDEGVYVYGNSREIEVLNDDAAEREFENMLVHVTCWRGLGSPEVLTMDQALEETMHHS